MVYKHVTRGENQQAFFKGTPEIRTYVMNPCDRTLAFRVVLFPAANVRTPAGKPRAS